MLLFKNKPGIGTNVILAILMKKQNPDNKLAFNKVAVAELNENQLNDINGGTNDLIRTIIITTGYGSWLMVV